MYIRPVVHDGVITERNAGATPAYPRIEFERGENMKRIAFVLVAVMALALAGCTQSMRLNTPSGFMYVSPAGNGYFLYQAGPGYFLVSSQRQGSQLGGIFEANVFVDIVYVGKELLVK